MKNMENMESNELRQGKWFAEDLLRKDTEEAYWCANIQATVIPNDDHNLLDILSSLGHKIYRSVEEILKKEGPKSTFENYRFFSHPSGIWESNPKSSFYDRKHKNSLDTMNNKIISGFFKGEINQTRTSPVVLYTKNWCFTSSGSIYALETYSETIGLTRL